MDSAIHNLSAVIMLLALLAAAGESFFLFVRRGALAYLMAGVSFMLILLYFWTGIYATALPNLLLEMGVSKADVARRVMNFSTGRWAIFSIAVIVMLVGLITGTRRPKGFDSWREQ